MRMQCKVNFQNVLRKWDGFGINYVATAQTRNYHKWPQDYGSFGLLTEEDRQQIIELIFGDDGLQPTIGKMFINSLLAGYTKPNAASINPDVLQPDTYDIETTNQWMEYFMKEGLKRVRARGDNFEIVSTLYGPAPWMTKQKIVRGRDLDPNEKYEVAKYVIAFAKHMRENAGLPVKHISLHNEGGTEEMGRWPEDGMDAPKYAGHDYNMIWPVEQVVDFIGFMGAMLEHFDLGDVDVTNGECTKLSGTTKYVNGIIADPKAFANFKLMTSHGFGEDYTSEPIDLLREKKPDSSAWVTSASWGKMDISFLTTIHRHIYESKINGYIPWAAVQRHSQWTGGDPNPGTAILVTDDGKWLVQKGYYLYKHYCPVAKSGMGVAETVSSDRNVMVSAFSSNGTCYPSSIVIINSGKAAHTVELSISGANAKSFTYVITSNDVTYEKGDDIMLRDNKISLEMPGESVITLQKIK